MSALTAPSFWVLTVLAGGRRHGYQIMREAASSSGETVQLKPATLYAALDRLERDGLIRSDGEEIVGGRARRYYRITDTGAQRLAAEAGRLERSTRAARASLEAYGQPVRPQAAEA